jgi:ATP-dependent helicase/nuclease subunit A
MQPKPKDAIWSDEQWEAIATSGQDTLVAAAAGSGKTAVLVERIIKKIVDDSVDVDKLLIVTFTNAAAAEMRTRIGKALEGALTKDPGSLHLRRQLSLLNRASISTLHSFCMNVLRRYYFKIGLDPAFRIVDQTEGELLREEVIEELFEEEYGKENNDSFYELVDRYSSDRNDIALQTLVQKLYDFSRSHPRPEAWLDKMMSSYNIDEETAIDDLPWTTEMLENIRLQLRGLLKLLNRADELTYEPGGPEPYKNNLIEDKQRVEGLLHASGTSWGQLYETFQNGAFGRLKPVKGDSYDERLKDQVKDLRNTVKKQVEKLKEELFDRRPESYVKDLCEMSPHIQTLVSLVKEFGSRYQRVKREKALVDFNDLEHDCLEVFLNPESTPDHLIPTEAALDYREQFDEVLVDEYQDTNLVQETIIRLVSTKETDLGNLFMVGDVKQSIYRFRLAEPGLFLHKYKRFQKDGKGAGLRIDLAKNFRSRREVLDGTNFLFRQLMNEKVGEINYDRDAELRLGADYSPSDTSDAELVLINRGEKEDKPDTTIGEEDPSDLAAEQLEARWIAQKIKTMIGDGNTPPYQVFDKDTGTMRPITYRDIVILMRSANTAAPTMLEEFKRHGIPGYAELSSGYFEAVEVAVMMSLLKVIDNPYQDIPLASVLRSPIVGLSGEEMAQTRIAEKKADYYDSLLTYLEKQPESDLYEKLLDFSKKLKSWRIKARGGALSDLIWQIYRETGYYDFVGGMPGGQQRQANLRALYDRARQYEQTSFRGLFRFLRFVERMQDRGSDLGTARALGEQEDVVRVMTIHKSKGLEYPVVFLAGLNKQFNFNDLRGSYMLHKELGFGTKYINPKLRISYPTLPLLAMKQKMKMEQLAEEMRVLYVALTRAREKLFLLGTVKEVEKTVKGWSAHIAGSDWLLPDYTRADAKRFLDWIGPAIMRHSGGAPLTEIVGDEAPAGEIFEDMSKWHVTLVESAELGARDEEEQTSQEEMKQAVKQLQSVPFESDYKEQVAAQLSWRYGYDGAAAHMSKQTVSEIKRQRESLGEGGDTQYIRRFRSKIGERPQFMQEKQLTAAERGTSMHTLMQHINLKKPVNKTNVAELIDKMVFNELLTEEQAGVIDVNEVLQFFESPLGQRLQATDEVRREVPFSLALPASLAYADWSGAEEETVMVQGVIDCVIKEGDEITLLDYKTDGIHGRFMNGFEGAKSVLADRYRVQLNLYARAVKQIWKKTPKEKYLYFFDGGHLLKL